MAQPLLQHPLTHLYSCSLPMRWGEMDALGHMNNVHYFRYFEEVRIQWINSLGADLASELTGPLLISATAVYHRPIFYPATLNIDLYAGPPGGSSVRTYYEVRLAGEPLDQIYTEGEGVLVWADYTQGRAIPLPDALRQRLSVSKK
jgi:acyl-CoA thioester hydrolase